MPASSVLVVGDGQVYDGPCTLRAIIFTPISANDYVDVYDGLDKDSGKKLFRAISAVVVTWCFCFGEGIKMANGIYLDGKDGEVETTIAFDPLDS